jgi:hypothetical protein
MTVKVALITNFPWLLKSFSHYILVTYFLYLIFFRVFSISDKQIMDLNYSSKHHHHYHHHPLNEGSYEEEWGSEEDEEGEGYEDGKLWISINTFIYM